LRSAETCDRATKTEDRAAGSFAALGQAFERSGIAIGPISSAAAYGELDERRTAAALHLTW
jgi:hypothetical protein